VKKGGKGKTPLPSEGGLRVKGKVSNPRRGLGGLGEEGVKPAKATEKRYYYCKCELDFFQKNYN
jgi:hypothetical protein